MSGLTIVTAPTTDPVSLEEVLAHTRADGADENGLLAGYLLAARQHLEKFTRRAFATQVVDQSFDGWPTVRVLGGYDTRLELALGPVQSIGSVTYVDSAGATQTLAANQYQLVRPADRLAYLVPAYGVTWPAVRDQRDAVTVRFTVGHASADPLPEPLRQALLLLVGHFAGNREATIVGPTVAVLPMGVQALSAPYCLEGWP